MEIGQHGLRRELKLWDLVPMQVVLIVWLGWTGFAAKQGASQVALWLLAIVLFYLPLAAVVMKLSRALPVEGGVYQWVKIGISPFAGYMAAWNLSIYAVSAFAVIGSILANGFAHAAGSWGPALSTSKPFAVVLTTFACLIAFLFNVRGLQLAKWWSQAGALLTVGTFLIMLYLLIRAVAMGTPLAHRAFALEWPGLSILTLSVFTKMSVSALSGFDASAVFSEECRKPENDVGRSVMIAAPLIAMIYILGTISVLAYMAPADVDLAAAVPQLMQAGFGPNGLGYGLTVIVVLGFSISFLASMVIFTGMIARLPMVAGWDGLLPDWWSELHPTFRTPSKAIAVVTASMLVLGILSLLGAGNQEAVQVSVGAGGASLCAMYMLLFAVILFGFRSSTISPGVGIRVAAFAAFSVSLGALIFQIVPVGQVGSTALFGTKVAGTFFAANALGAFLYWRGTRRALEEAKPGAALL
jgi:amino acid transporter